MPDLSRLVVAIDPAVTSGEEADETGLIVAGRDYDGRGYVLDDRTGRYAPIEWAREAIMLYRKYDADRIVAEVNNGGDLVANTIRMVDENVSFKGRARDAREGRSSGADSGALRAETDFPRWLVPGARRPAV